MVTDLSSFFVVIQVSKSQERLCRSWTKPLVNGDR